MGLKIIYYVGSKVEEEWNSAIVNREPREGALNESRLLSIQIWKRNTAHSSSLNNLW